MTGMEIVLTGFIVLASWQACVGMKSNHYETKDLLIHVCLLHFKFRNKTKRWKNALVQL